MKLKNKEEREKFIKNYHEWDLIYDLLEINVKIYRKTLSNGAIIYVTEFKKYIGYKKEFRDEVRYNLILDMTDGYKTQLCCGSEYHVAYNPNGCSLGIIVDYMTKNRDVLEVTE